MNVRVVSHNNEFPTALCNTFTTHSKNSSLKIGSTVCFLMEVLTCLSMNSECGCRLSSTNGSLRPAMLYIHYTAYITTLYLASLLTRFIQPRQVLGSYDGDFHSIPVLQITHTDRECTSTRLLLLCIALLEQIHIESQDQLGS